MHFAVSLDHRTFFTQNRYLECEGLLSAEQIALLQNEIDQTLAKRLKLSPLKSKEASSAELFRVGYDLWRENETIKKTAFKHLFAEIAAQLFATNLLRIAFDQYFSPKGNDCPITGVSSLSEISSAKPLAGALLIRLSDEPFEMPDQHACPIPSQLGNVIFLAPQFPIHWETLFALKNARFLLVAYAPKQSMYYLEKKDPHTHNWKRIGYVFGDNLNDSVHPILHRS